MLAEGHLSRRTIQKILVLLHGILKRAKRKGWVATNAAEDAERVTVRRSGDFNVLSPEEVHAVARADASELYGAIYVAAAFTGPRMGELRAFAGPTSTSPSGSFTCAAATPGQRSARPSRSAYVACR
jgi:tellurite resistance-related uncharacterized protein